MAAVRRVWLTQAKLWIWYYHLWIIRYWFYLWACGNSQKHTLSQSSALAIKWFKVRYNITTVKLLQVTLLQEYVLKRFCIIQISMKTQEWLWPAVLTDCPLRAPSFFVFSKDVRWHSNKYLVLRQVWNSRYALRPNIDSWFVILDTFSYLPSWQAEM
jgi:hypothetical protein